MKIKADKIGNVIEDALKQYKKEVVDTAAEKAVTTVRREIVKYMKTSGNTPVRTGDYRKSWKGRTDKVVGNLQNEYSVTIYADAPEYRLTHLLEHGHRSRNDGFVKAHEHIAQAQEQAEKLFTEVFEKELKL